MSDKPSLRVAVVMDREAAPNRWEAWRHSIVEVVPDEGGFGTTPRLLRDDGKTARVLHPGFEVTLYRDEGEGYWLNNVPLQAELREWLQLYTDEHYRPEPKQRKRPASFQRPEDRK
jgi:hypothetical protein